MAISSKAEYLDIAREIMRGFKPPDGAFDPKGTWSHRYRLYTVVSARGILVTNRIGGELLISRSPMPDGRARLQVEYTKNTQFAGASKVSGELICSSGPLSPPFSWKLEFAGCPPTQGTVASYHSAEHSGHAPAGPHTASWALFDAVQRMPRREDPPLQFTLWDPGEVAKPNQTLAFYRTVQLDDRWPGAPKMRVHGFLQVGEGISPQVYWVDDAGRLILLVAGLDAYLLEPETSPHA